jgi:hypothetical protein
MAAIEYTSGTTTTVLNPALREELDGKLIVNHPDYASAFFGDIVGLKDTTDFIFRSCQDGDTPLYALETGWIGLNPYDEATVLTWLGQVLERFQELIVTAIGSLPRRHRFARLPSKPVHGSMSMRKLDIAFVLVPPGSSAEASSTDCLRWQEVEKFGELKKNQKEDNKVPIWEQIAGYNREIFGAQPGRRFVVGFSICAAYMRLFEFDRSGGVASDAFDIHLDGRRFVETMTAFLLMNASQTGFDPSIETDGSGANYITIERNGVTERIVLKEVMVTTKAISSRGTTVWKGFVINGNERTRVVVKDTWQYTDRPDEGDMLRAATDRGAENVVAYYHHEVVHVGAHVDDTNLIRSRLRPGQGKLFKFPVRPEKRGFSSSAQKSAGGRALLGAKRSATAMERDAGTSSSVGELPGQSLAPTVETLAGHARVHRRLYMSDLGKPLTKASSLAQLLRALADCINGMLETSYLQDLYPVDSWVC